MSFWTTLWAAGAAENAAKTQRRIKEQNKMIAQQNVLLQQQAAQQQDAAFQNMLASNDKARNLWSKVILLDGILTNGVVGKKRRFDGFVGTAQAGYMKQCGIELAYAPLVNQAEARMKVAKGRAKKATVEEIKEFKRVIKDKTGIEFGA
jgi:hypothetical protein